MIKSFPSSHQLFESPAGSRVNLRRATTAFSERKEKKPLKTYGSKASQDDSRIFRSDLHVQNHSSLPSTVGTSSFHEDGISETTRGALRDGLNDMTLMEDKVGHGANSDAEYTLQRNCAPGDSTISALPAMSKKAGVISDKFPERSDGSTMPLTPDETPALHGSFARSTPSKLRHSSDDPVSFPIISKRSSAQIEEVPISDPIDTKSKKRPRVQLDLPDPCVAENIPVPDYDNVSPTKRARTGRTEECGNQPDRDDTYDELSLSVSKQQPSHTTFKQSKTKRPREKDELDDAKLGSDDICIGLPVEKYQPRPSRSRSGRLDEELLVPVDFSKRPEAAAKGKKKNKRRKTTAFEQLVHEDEDETDIFQVKIPSPSKDPEKVRDAPTKNKPEVTDRPQPDMGTLKDIYTAPPPKKRGRPKKVVSEPHGEQEKLTRDPNSPTKSRIAVLNRSTSKKSKVPLGHDSDQSSAEEDFPFPPEIKPDISDPPPRSPQSPPFQKEPPVPIPVPVTRSPSPTKPNIQLSSALQTPPKTAPAKGPDKHSPINSAKVAYRVGLSKRARIEPLLRVVRK